MRPRGKEKLVQSVARSLCILEALAEEEKPLTLSELGAKTGLNVATIHRLLHTLMHFGYVQQEDFMGKYKLGVKAFQIGNAALYSLDIRAVARPYIQNLVDYSNETVNLAVLQQGEVVYIDQVASRSMITMFAKVGSRGPCHCTAAGKVLLAFQGEEELEALLEGGLRSYTPNTIVDPEELKKELEKIRREGYSIDNEELEEGIRCVAAPIYNHENKVIAAISLSGPSARISQEHLQEGLLEKIKETALEISKRLGYSKA
ncbi:MAG: IclR family transcriptional regulator [Firmicutes bacterium]|nr:IclR family transcriptional regulator [Bacillota bacterium]